MLTFLDGTKGKRRRLKSARLEGQKSRVRVNSWPGRGAVRPARDSRTHLGPLTPGEAWLAAAERLSRQPAVGSTHGLPNHSPGAPPGTRTRVQARTRAHACVWPLGGTGAPLTRADAWAPGLSGSSAGVSSSSVALCHPDAAPCLQPNFSSTGKLSFGEQLPSGYQTRFWFSHTPP